LADYGLHGEFKKVFDFLAAINQTAYKNIYLLSNEVLSKNPFSSNFLRKFLKRENPELPDTFTVFSRLLIYYLRSFIYFGIYLLSFWAFYLARFKYTVDSRQKELILIDTFFLTDRVEKNKTYEDPYFVGLKEILERLGKHYAYLPVFYTTKNPVKLFNILKILKKDKMPMLTEYQLLSGKDIVRIFFFLLRYPIEVLIFAKNIKEETYEARLLRRELIDNLSYTAFLKFSRYLQGIIISEMAYESIKVISWFENQTIDKNLYKGLREGRGKVKIYGSQPFVYPKSLLNILPDENEAKFGIVPDKIIVNGTYFIPKNTSLNFVVGPSFRYKKIFTTEIDAAKQKGILILMPYFVEDIENILKLLDKADLRSRFFMIKAHPSTPVKRFRKLLPVNAEVTGGDVYDLFKTAKITISSESGSMVESACLGIPVISIKNIRSLNHNPLPSYGKGVIWDEVENAEGLNAMISRFEGNLNNENKYLKIKTIAQEYKRMFFCEPTDENIIKAYDFA